MRVIELQGPPAPELATALSRFEKQFTYPLGPGRSFRIAHGRDYPRFFRAIGEATCFVAEDGGSVRGVISAALRRLRGPGGQESPALYLGDLKIAPQFRGGTTLARLVRSVMAWSKNRAEAAFAVVMDGTAATPLGYTGRLGIPLFQEIGKLTVLRLPTSDVLDCRYAAEATETEGVSCYLQLTKNRYSAMGGNQGERSEIEPVWYEADGKACGCLEDTRKAKRLIADDGTEMRSAHLSYFAYSSVEAGAEVVTAAARRAAQLGYRDLFLAVAHPEAAAFEAGLPGLQIVRAPAKIYAAHLPSEQLWNINTAEI